MKYAIISDVHGNIHAFEAVLADAKANGADMYLLLGDYASSFPHGNAVIEVIRNLEPATVIRGNGEGYFINLHNNPPPNFDDEQFKPVYWGYKNLTPENYEYVANLPETVTITNGSINIHLNHAMSLFFRSPQIPLFYSSHFGAMMSTAPFTHEEYLARARDALLSCKEAVAEIRGMPEGIYLLGHNHLQFHMEFEGRTFINPGSCGEPLNWDTRACYTMLTINGPEWEIEEKRVKYNLDAVNEGLINSGYDAYTPAWSEVMRLELYSGNDHWDSFVFHVSEARKKLGCTNTPVSKEDWDVIVSTWDKNK